MYPRLRRITPAGDARRVRRFFTKSDGAVYFEQENTSWTPQTSQRTLDSSRWMTEMLVDRDESRELGYISCTQNHSTTHYSYQQLFSPAREQPFPCRQCQTAKENAYL